MPKKKDGRDFGPPPTAPTVLDGLKTMYRDKLLPMEKKYYFDQFYSSFLTDADIVAKPMVLLLGQYSVGKTTFIRYLMGRDFPGMRIGPEPTTERFHAIMSGPEEQTIPGNALAVHKDMPFTSLTKFGTSFLNRLEGSQCQAPLLDHLYLVDTPGVLSGTKQREGREYNFPSIVEWFAERADLIMLLFDAHKLDISDEFKDTIHALKGQEDKVRVVLNKADRVSGQQLMRVYGALMWSLGKVVGTPEVMRVYVGSFWEEECQNKEFEYLFHNEETDLFKDLRSLPANAATRKINNMVKRARVLRTHALILSHLKSQMPSLFGKDKKQRELIDNLADTFNQIHKTKQIPVGDFPELARYKEQLRLLEFSKLPKVNDEIYEEIDYILNTYIPQLLDQLTEEKAAAREMQKESGSKVAPPPLPEPSRGHQTRTNNPFQSGRVKTPQELWEDKVQKEAHMSKFKSLEGSNSGKIAGEVAYNYLIDTGLEQEKLKRVWDLSDIDEDGSLDEDEFALCMYFIEKLKSGEPVPATLSEEIFPPSKRRGDRM